MDAGLTKLNTFLDRRDRQPRDAQLQQRLGDGDGAMSVGVGLDDGEDLTRGGEPAAQQGHIMG